MSAERSASVKGTSCHRLRQDHAEVIGATVNEWLIDLGVGSSPKHKLTA
jgi:haloalkane dehalogenase